MRSWSTRSYAALGVLDESGSRLAEFITVGFSEEETDRIGARPEGHGILGLLILDPQPLRLPDLHAHPDSFGFPPGHPPMTSFLGVPIRLRGVVYGNLYLTDKADGQVFTDVDQELAVGLAAAAGVAIENARLHEQTRTAGLLDERERIARDLHDDVIQRLFATGLSLQAAAHALHDPAAVARITGAVEDLNVSIRQIRSTIFELNQRRSAEVSLRGDIIAVCDEAATTLGFKPRDDITGPIDSSRHRADTQPPAALPTRGAVQRRPPRSRLRPSRSISASASGRLRLHVADDGVGYRPTPGRPSSGLDNMRVRASALGGAFSIERRDRGRHAHDVGRPSRHLTSVVPHARWDARPYAERVRRAIVSVVSARSSSEATVATPARDRLVVGFDASNAAGPTIAWARAEAAARAVSLRIVSFAVRGPADGTEHIQHSDTLVSYAADTDLVVVGASTSGDTTGWLRRCVADGASRRSACPLVVVRGDTRQPLQRIVVGIDNLSGAEAALDWAADEARLHIAELVVVHAWQRRDGPSRFDPQQRSREI